MTVTSVPEPAAANAMYVVVRIALEAHEYPFGRSYRDRLRALGEQKWYRKFKGLIGKRRGGPRILAAPAPQLGSVAPGRGRICRHPDTIVTVDSVRAFKQLVLPSHNDRVAKPSHPYHR
jgi:hypothetical protein